MTRAIEWDGVGPKRDCLLRVIENNVAEWVEVGFTAGEHGTLDEYRSYLGEFSLIRVGDLDGFFIKSDDGGEMRVTHYADIPAIVEVRRIESDVEEGAVVG